jgi:hypothetical protein
MDRLIQQNPADESWDASETDARKKFLRETEEKLIAELKDWRDLAPRLKIERDALRSTISDLVAKVGTDPAVIDRKTATRELYALVDAFHPDRVMGDSADRESLQLIRGAKTLLIEMLAASTTADRNPPNPNNGLPDGPAALGNVFWWNGKSVEIEPKPFALLKLVWESQNRTISTDDAIAKVWEDQEGNTSLKNAQARINAALAELACPLFLSFKSNTISLK